MANMDFLWASYLNHLTTFMYRTCGCQFVLCHSPCNIQSAYSARQLWHTSSKAQLLCYNWLQLFLWNGSSFPYCMLHIQFHSKTKTRKYTFHVIKGKDILQSKVIEWPLLIHFLVILKLISVEKQACAREVMKCLGNINNLVEKAWTFVQFKYVFWIVVFTYI